MNNGIFMKNMKKVSVVFLLLIMTACTNTQITEQEKNLRSVLMSKEEFNKSYKVDETWWKQLNSSELNNLMELVLTRNVALKKAYVGMDLAQLQSHYQWIDLIIPNFGGGVDYGNSSLITENGLEGNKSSFSQSLGGSYDANIYGKSVQIVQANKNVQASEQDIRALKMNIEIETVKLYLQWIANQQSLALIDEQFTLYDEVLEQLKLKLSYGFISEIDYETARLQVMDLKVIKNNFNNQQDSIEQALRDLMSYQPHQPLPLTKKDQAILPKFSQMDLTLPMTVLINRPDVHSSILRLDQAWFNVHKQYYAWLPKISIQSGISSSAQSLGEVFSFPLGFSSKISLNLPFLNFPKLLVKNKETNLKLKERVLNFEQTLVSALNEVDSTFKHYQRMQKQLTLLDNKYQQAKKVKNLTAWQYQKGMLNTEDYLNMLQKFSQEEQSFMQGQIDYIKMQMKLFKVLGGVVSKKQ